MLAERRKSEEMSYTKDKNRGRLRLLKGQSAQTGEKKRRKVPFDEKNDTNEGFNSEKANDYSTLLRKNIEEEVNRSISERLSGYEEKVNRSISERLSGYGEEVNRSISERLSEYEEKVNTSISDSLSRYDQDKKKNKKVWELINCGLVVAAISAIVGIIYDFHGELVKLNTQIEGQNTNIDTRLTSFENTITGAYQAVSNGQDKLDETARDLSIRIGVIETSDKYIRGTATKNFGYNLMNLCKKDDINSYDGKLWDDSSVVLSNDIEKYTMPELADKKLLIFYEQKEQEIYFYGQYSQNNKWDGDCIINVYNKNNNELVLVTDAVYEDGTLKNYRQAFQHEKDGVKLWNISNRTCTKDGNEGETWTYYRKEGEGIFKDSSKNIVEPKDIYSVTQVKNNINTSPEGFYHGITSNGLYNDTTGDAYLVKFSMDGTVRTLYTGNFLNGEFEDETNDAWYISRKEEIMDSKYAYYKAVFHEGEPVNDIPTESNLTKERILEIISYRFYKPVLKWHGFDNI